MNSEGELDWLLHGLSTTVAGVRSAVILSPDGLPLGRSAGLNDAVADHLAALAAGANGLANVVGQRFYYGEVSQTVIQLDTALLFITPAGRGTCVALVADCDDRTDPGQIAFEISELVKRLGQHMIANPRFSVRDLGFG
jgi:predicted regulator of Ras-like GTPase activity (Roadblock/LC7/MglB family)